MAPLTAKDIEDFYYDFTARGLSRREIEVIKTFLKCDKSKDMAELLFISEKTVKFHLTSIYKKLEVKNRIGLQRKLSEITAGLRPGQVRIG